MKRTLASILTLCMLVTTLLSPAALAAEMPLAQDGTSNGELSGSCGSNVTWAVEDDHVLRITGSGPMKDYTSNSLGIFGDIPGIGETVAVPQIRKVVIGEGVTHIGAYAFQGLEGPPTSSETDGNMVESISLPGTVTSIGESALPYSHLREVTVTANNPVYYAEDGVLFSKTDGETELVYYPPQRTAASYQIPDGVTAISAQMETRCRYLESLTLPTSMENIKSGALRQWANLDRISVIEGNQHFRSVDGVLFSRDQRVLVCYPSEKSGTHYTIPAGVAELAEGAFFGADQLESVDLPEGVEVLGESVFSGCFKLHAISIPEGVTVLGDWAFSECESLSSVTIPSTVREIGDFAFMRTLLASVCLPRSLQRMGADPFYESSLADIYYAGSETEWEQIEKKSLNLDGVTVHFGSESSAEGGLLLDHTILTVQQGKNFQLQALDTHGFSVTWASSDTEVATVNQSGLVTAALVLQHQGEGFVQQAGQLQGAAEAGFQLGVRPDQVALPAGVLPEQDADTEAGQGAQPSAGGSGSGSGSRGAAWKVRCRMLRWGAFRRSIRFSIRKNSCIRLEKDSVRSKAGQ